MKIKRYFASSMREAMRLAREEQGPEVVILGSESRDDGIELIAALDYDAALLRQALGGGAQTRDESPAPAPETTTAATPKVVWARDPHMTRLQEELRDLRGLLEHSLRREADAALRQSPLRRAALESLSSLGLDADLAREIAADLPDAADPARLRALPLGQLARRIRVSAEPPLRQARVLSLVGPTGAGKTTTLAKLAARAVAEHGARQVALVTTDDHRAGAEAQLAVYARLLGVPLLMAPDPETLARHLDTLSDCRCVLVDTAGAGPADERLRRWLPALAALGPASRTLLALPAGLSREDALACISRFASAHPSAVVLTKADECVRMGGSLSALIGTRTPLAYIADGQRVPEDLHVARAADLVVRAVSLARAAERELRGRANGGTVLPMPAAADREVLHG